MVAPVCTVCYHVALYIAFHNKVHLSWVITVHKSFIEEVCKCIWIRFRCHDGDQSSPQIQLPIQYTNLLPARQNGVAIIVPASKPAYESSRLPASIPYQLADLYQQACFKPLTTFFNIWFKCLKYCQNVKE